MQTHLRKYICSTGRKEASRSECYETLDVGCPASSVSHLLYLNHRRPTRRTRFLRASSPSPGTARLSRLQPIRRPSCVIRLKASLRPVIIRSRYSTREISLALPGGGSIDVSIPATTMLSGSASSIISNLLPRLALGRNFD